jgi:GNAT superfamily N-acetyltransferase
MTPFHVSVQDDYDPEEVSAILDGLRSFNQEHAGPPHRSRLAVVLRDPGGRVVGGLIGETAWRWLYIDAFWIDEVLRGKGYGRIMLRAAEDRARLRGCTNAYLDTFDFQALPFYQHEGYAIFGTLEGFPPGHRRYYLSKLLTP